jgi:hypothetical protein
VAWSTGRLAQILASAAAGGLIGLIGTSLASPGSLEGQQSHS